MDYSTIDRYFDPAVDYAHAYGLLWKLIEANIVPLPDLDTHYSPEAEVEAMRLASEHLLWREDLMNVRAAIRGLAGYGAGIVTTTVAV